MTARMLVIAGGAALVACGTSTVARSPSPSSSPPAPAQREGRWADMDRAHRLDYMGLVVFPAMKAKFQAFGAEAFAEFRCQTCHGDGFDKPGIDFRMPNVLPPLSRTDPIGGGMAYDPETTKFMVETVVPTMAELLGESPFDPRTGKGFSCFRCHPSSTTDPTTTDPTTRPENPR